MTFGLNKVKKKKNRWLRQLQCPNQASPPPTWAVHIAASLKENGPRLITTLLQKPRHDIMNILLRLKDGSGQDSKLMKRNQNFGFCAGK